MDPAHSPHPFSAGRVVPVLLLLTTTASAEAIDFPRGADESDSTPLGLGSFMLLGAAALALNFLLTMAQTALASIGPATLAEFGEDKSHPRWLGRIGEIEIRCSLGSLFLLLTTCYAIARCGFGLFLAAPTIGAVAGVALALVLHLIVVEVFARSLALSRPMPVLRFLLPVARVISSPFLPLAVALRGVRGIKPPSDNPLALSDMHLRLLPSLRGVERILDEDAFEMIDSVRDFAETTAQEIMTPRTEVAGIPRNMAVDAVYERLRESEFSRLVVYEGSLDQVVGTLLAKEVLLRRPTDPFSMLRQPLVVGEKTRLPELLRLIRANRTHLVLVQDEYGGLSGIVTLHDLFESIVGHIEDVDDDEELWIEKKGLGDFLVNGRVEIWELNEEVGSDLDEEFARTVGGYVFNTLGRPARIGDEVVLGGLRMTVQEIAENRVKTVHVAVLPSDETADAAEDSSR